MAKLKGSEIQEWAEEKLFSKVDTIQVETNEDLERVREIEMQFCRRISQQYYKYKYPFPLRYCIRKRKIEKVYNKLTKEYKESKQGRIVQKYLELNKNPKLGEKYVDFEMENVQGRKVRLSENLGKVTLLEFWASNCGPCRTENPNLVKTYKKYKENGFEIFAVSLDVKKRKLEKSH